MIVIIALDYTFVKYYNFNEIHYNKLMGARMTNRHIRIFVKTAELRSMSEAAKAMYISQSSVSQAISEIEKEYGVKLFERLSKGVYLTQAG